MSSSCSRPGAPLTLDEISTAEKLAAWFATGESTGRAHEALALLQQEYGTEVAEEIWVRGSQMADGLGVWVNRPKTEPAGEWLQAGRWRKRCPDCPYVAQNPDRIGVREDLARHRETECPARAEADVASCRVCGCTEDAACEGGCHWVPDPEMLGDLCSACVEEVA